ARREHRLPAGGPDHSLHEVGRRGVLEEEPGRAVAQGGEDHLVGVEGGQYEDPCRRAALGEAAGGGQAVEAGHPDVHQDHGRALPLHDGERLVPVGRLPDDVDGVAPAEDEPEPRADAAVVVHHDHPDRCHRHSSSQGSQTRTAKQPSDPGPCSSTPPASSTRSASPTSPSPAPGAAGVATLPAGGTSLCTSTVSSPPGPPARRTTTALPGACLQAFVSASWTTR